MPLDNYDYMSMEVRCSYLTRDEDGNMMNFYDWENSGTLMGFEQNLQTEYSLRAMPLQNPGNYSCVFYIKDAHGNKTYSEMISLQ